MNTSEWMQQQTPVTGGTRLLGGMGVAGPCVTHQLQPLGFSRVAPGLGHSGSSGWHMLLPMRLFIALVTVWEPKVTTSLPGTCLELDPQPASNGAGEQEAAGLAPTVWSHQACWGHL